jgi:hypothetical protein
MCPLSPRPAIRAFDSQAHILIHTLIFLARMTYDHTEAVRYHREAEIALAKVRAYESKDANRSAKVDAALREMQESFDEVGEFLAAEEEDRKALRAAAVAREEEAAAAAK